jgi:hypothetical protein
MSDTEPRWLDLDSAARRINVRPDRMRRLVKAGVLPEPSYALGKRMPRWDRDLLDAAFVNRPHSGRDINKASRANAEQIIEGARRARRSLHQG